MQVLFVLLATIVPFSLTELSFLFRQIHYEVVGLHAYSPNSIPLIPLIQYSWMLIFPVTKFPTQYLMLICTAEC